jgi:hypothetical protein
VNACSTLMSKLSSPSSAIPTCRNMKNCERSYTKMFLISRRLKTSSQATRHAFFCLGVSAVGMKEEEYRRLTYDLTVSVARTLAKLNPAMTFIYVSGAGTDSTESCRLMWARVKGKTENAILQMRFKAVYLFRPAYIQPLLRRSHEDGMVWRILRCCETFLSATQNAFPELRDNDRMRRSCHAERNEAGFLEPCP